MVMSFRPSPPGFCDPQTQAVLGVTVQAEPVQGDLRNQWVTLSAAKVEGSEEMVKLIFIWYTVIETLETPGIRMFLSL